MDQLGSGLSLVPLAGVLAVVVGLSVLAIQKVKMLVCCHFKGHWTQSRWLQWVWLAASFAVPLGLVAVVFLPTVQGWINFYLPADWQVHLSAGDLVPSWLSAGLGSNGVYGILKAKGWLGDYSAGGPNDVTTTPVPAVAEPSTPLSVPGPVEDVPPPTPASTDAPVRVRRFLEVWSQGGPNDWVLVEDGQTQRMYPIERKEGTDG